MYIFRPRNSAAIFFDAYCQFSTYSLSIQLRMLPNLLPLTTDIQCDAGHPGIFYLGEPWKESVSSEGASISWKEIGIELHIPPGAIPEGETLELRVRPCLSGPFVPPEGYDLACPVYHISPAFHFLCDVQVTMYHCCHLETLEHCQLMTFMSSSSRPSYNGHHPLYQFKTLSTAKFEPSCVYGSLSLKHFCNTTIGVKRQRSDSDAPAEEDEDIEPTAKKVKGTLIQCMFHHQYSECTTRSMTVR